MTAFSAVQIALGVLAIAIAAVRLRELLFQAAIDERRFGDALTTAVRAGQLGLGVDLARACLPAYSAQTALAGLSERHAGRSPRPAVQELEATLTARTSRGRGALIVIGRAANPVALIGVIHALAVATHGGEGLIALQRGLAERLALQRSLLMLALGLGTSWFCFAAASLMQRRARALTTAIARVEALVDAAVQSAA